MSKVNSDTIMFFGVILFAVFMCFLTYSILVLNHRENVSRDKYLIENCPKVTSKPNSLFTDGKTYECATSEEQ